MALACAKHHSFQYRASVGVQTDEAPSPVGENVAPAAAPYAAIADITKLLEPPLPDKFVEPVSADTYASLSHMTEYVTPAPVDFYAVIEYAVPASAGTYATPTPVIEHAAPAHTVTFTTPSPVTDDVAPSSSCAAPATVIEYVAPATRVTVNPYVAPAPVIEDIAPPPAAYYLSFSQQLPSAETNEAVAVEASAPQNVGSRLPLDGLIMDIFILRGVEEIDDVIEDQIFDAPVPQTMEEQFVAVTPTPATTDATFPHEKFDEACKMLALKQADLRQAKFAIQRLELHAAVSGQACDANLVSDARQAYESNKVIIGKMLREIRVAAERLYEEMSSSSPPIVRRAKKGRYKK